LDARNTVVSASNGTVVILIRNSNDDIDAAIAIDHEREHFKGIASEPKAFVAEVVLATKCHWMKYDNLDKFFARDENGAVTNVDLGGLEQALTPTVNDAYKRLVNQPGAIDPYLDKLKAEDPGAFRIGDFFQNVGNAP
jgi:hypothetical protein